jgi:hypothetical protein
MVIIWLDVDGCDLDCLLKGMGQLEKLFKLILKENKKLARLPKCIEEMKSLTRLGLGGCDFNCLLEGMGWLEKLSSLVLSSNKKLAKLLESA